MGLITFASQFTTTSGRGVNLVPWLNRLSGSYLCFKSSNFFTLGPKMSFASTSAATASQRTKSQYSFLHLDDNLRA
jgi:hypothetical protein